MATATRRRSSPGYIVPETLIEADFSKGMISDGDQASLAPGQVVLADNWMLDKVNPYKRGGSTYYGSWVADTISRVVFAEFPNIGKQEIVAMDSGNLFLYYKNAASGSEGQASGTIGPTAGYLPSQKPVIVADPDNIDGANTGGVLVWGVAAGNDYPRVYPGAGHAVRVLNTSSDFTPAMGGRYIVYYKSRLAIAASTNFENRMWFSPAGVLKDVEGLVADNLPTLDESYIDFDFGITGTAALQNSMLIFSRNHVERLTGSAPPPGGDMSHGPILGAAGCASARSIANYKDAAIWAGPQGVYMTSGVGANDLTAEGGVLRAWQESLADWDERTSTIAAEVVRNFYVVATQISGGTQQMWICDIPRRVWWQVSPGSYSWLANNPMTPGHLYATRDDGHIYNLHTYFEPDIAVKLDADAAPITATLKTRMVNGGQVGFKNFREARVDYDLQGGVSPTLTIGVTGETSENDLGSIDLVTTGPHAREPVTMNATDQGLQFTITQDTACGDCRLFGLEIDYRPMPLTRGAGVTAGGALTGGGAGSSSAAGISGFNLVARGLAAESYPISLIANSNALISGVVYCGLVEVPVDVPITEVVLGVAQAGLGTTALTRMEVGLLSTAGVTLATSGNIKTNPNWLTSGAQRFPLSAPYTPTGTGQTVSLYACVLQVGAWGTQLLVGRQGTSAVLTKPVTGFARPVAKVNGRTDISGTLTLIAQGANENIWVAVR